MSAVDQHPCEPTGNIDRLARVLRARYDLHAEEITRLPMGQSTINYRVATAEQTVFVKHYPPDTDLDADRAGIAMSCLAGRAGVPVASPWTSVQGEVLAFLVAWELGRIAFDPRTVVLDPGWLDSARALVAAYLTENPTVQPADIACCGRITLIQLIRSLYGVKQHYQGHGLLQDDLDRFWSFRHQAATTLLGHLNTVEHTLGELSVAGTPGAHVLLFTVRTGCG